MSNVVSITFQQITSESGAGWAHPRKMALTTADALCKMSHCVKNTQIIIPDSSPFLLFRFMCQVYDRGQGNPKTGRICLDKSASCLKPFLSLYDALCPVFCHVIRGNVGICPWKSGLGHLVSTTIPHFDMLVLG